MHGRAIGLTRLRHNQVRGRLHLFAAGAVQRVRALGISVTDLLSFGQGNTEDIFVVALTGYMLDCTIAPCAAIAQ